MLWPRVVRIIFLIPTKFASYKNKNKYLPRRRRPHIRTSSQFYTDETIKRSNEKNQQEHNFYFHPSTYLRVLFRNYWENQKVNLKRSLIKLTNTAPTKQSWGELVITKTSEKIPQLPSTDDWHCGKFKATSMQFQSLISMLPAIYNDDQINYFRQLCTVKEREKGEKMKTHRRIFITIRNKLNVFNLFENNCSEWIASFSIRTFNRSSLTFAQAEGEYEYNLN